MTHIYMETPVQEMRKGDRVLVDGYKRPFDVVRVDGDCLTCRNNRGNTLRIHARRFRRIVKRLAEVVR